MQGPPKEKSLYDINKRAAPAAPLFSPSSARLPAAAPPSDEKVQVQFAGVEIKQSRHKTAHCTH